MGDWQKEFVSNLVEFGLTHEHAMIAMGLTCEERLNSYMVGYNKGFNGGFKVGFDKGMDVERNQQGANSK